MIKFFNNKYVLVAILCVLLVGVALTFSVRSTETASADYQDIVNNPTAIVNFNQQFNNTLSARANYQTITISKDNYTYSVSGYFSSYSLYLPFTTIGETYVNLIIGHKYYIDPKLNIVSGNWPNLILSNGETHYIQNIGNNIYTADVNANAYFGYWHFPANTYNFNVTPLIVDLSAMFGIGSEPSLQECQDLFVADYYAYNTGSPVSLSGLNAFSTGYNQALGDLDVVYNSNIVATSVYTTNPQYPVDNSGMTFFTTAEDTIYYINFDNIYFKNDVFNIHLNSLETNRTANYSDDFIEFGSYSNGLFTPFYSIPLNNPDSYTSFVDGGGNTFYNCTYNNLNATFTLTQDVSVLYFRTITDVSTTTFYGMSMKIHSYNIYTAIQNAFDNGYDKANTLYAQQLASYTDVNGAGYKRIYDAGYEAGQNASVSAARKKTYTFTNFLGALFDVPVTTLKSLLDFNFLGFNLKNFVFSILTLSIVFAIIKLILVKSGDGK